MSARPGIPPTTATMTPSSHLLPHGSFPHPPPGAHPYGPPYPTSAPGGGPQGNMMYQRTPANAAASAGMGGMPPSMMGGSMGAAGRGMSMGMMPNPSGVPTHPGSMQTIRRVTSLGSMPQNPMMTMNPMGQSMNGLIGGLQPVRPGTTVQGQPGMQPGMHHPNAQQLRMPQRISAPQGMLNGQMVQASHPSQPGASMTQMAQHHHPGMPLGSAPAPGQPPHPGQQSHMNVGQSPGQQPGSNNGNPANQPQSNQPNPYSFQPNPQNPQPGVSVIRPPGMLSQPQLGQGQSFSSLQPTHPSQQQPQQPQQSQSQQLPPGQQSHMVIPSQPTGPQGQPGVRPGMNLGPPFGVPTMHMGMSMQPTMQGMQNMQNLPQSNGSSPNRQAISPHGAMPGARNVTAGGSATATPSIAHSTPSMMQNTPGAANASTPGRMVQANPMNSNAPKQSTPSRAPTPSFNAPTPGGRPSTSSGQPPSQPTNFPQQSPRMQSVEMTGVIHSSPRSMGPPGTPRTNPNVVMNGPGGGPIQNPGMYNPQFRPTPSQHVNSAESLFAQAQAQQAHAQAHAQAQAQARNEYIIDGGKPPQRSGTFPMAGQPHGVPGLSSGPTGSVGIAGGNPAGPGPGRASTPGSHGDVTMAPPGRSSAPTTPRIPPGRPTGLGGNPGLGGNLGYMAPPAQPAVRNVAPEMNAAPGDPLRPQFSMEGIGFANPRPESVVQTRSPAFGVIRLLNFSSKLGDLKPEEVADFWPSLISEQFTDNAVFQLRLQKEGSTTNPFVTLRFPLIAKFFKTLTDSNIVRMAFSLDGVTEYQTQQEYTVHCSHARWLMEYDSGYVVELEGVLQATCLTVPMEPFNPTSVTADENRTSGNGSGSGQTQNQSGGGAGSSNQQTSSPAHANSSPASNPANPSGSGSNPNASLNASPRSRAVLPYTVKIERFSFDSRALRKWIDVDKTRMGGASIKLEYGVSAPKYQIPPEPEMKYGIPVTTLRMLELSDNDHALEPFMDFMDTYPGGPIQGLSEFVKLPASMGYQMGMMTTSGPAGPGGSMGPMVHMGGMGPMGPMGPMGGRTYMSFPPGLGPPNMPPHAFAFAPSVSTQGMSQMGQGGLPEGDHAYLNGMGMFTDSGYGRGPEGGMGMGPGMNASIDPSLTSSNGFGGGPPPPPLGSSLTGGLAGTGTGPGTAGNPNGVANAGTPGANLTAPSNTAPNLSPPTAPKSPTKKGSNAGGAPGSPVKAASDASDVKEKSGKRKTVQEASDQPGPHKRARRRGSRA